MTKLLKMPKKAKAKNAKSAKIAEIAETEISRNVRNLGLFWKNRGAFEKKLEFSSKSPKVANLLQNAYQMVSFLKNVFHPAHEVFLAKKKSGNFECWKN